LSTSPLKKGFYSEKGNSKHPGRKGGTAIAVRKGIPHSHVDLPPLISIEATGVYIL
jgi:hypothetical protein